MASSVASHSCTEISLFNNFKNLKSPFGDDGNMYTVVDNDGNELMVGEPPPEYIYSYSDYLLWKFEERLELFRGKLFKMSVPNTNHQRIIGRLFLRLGYFFEHKKCEVFVAPFMYGYP